MADMTLNTTTTAFQNSGLGELLFVETKNALLIILTLLDVSLVHCRIGLR